MPLNDVVLRSKHNPLIKKIRQLRQKKIREEIGLFIFEGEKLFSEALTWNAPLETVVLSETYYQKHGGDGLLSELTDSAVDCVIASDTVFSYISSQVHPEGVLCVAKQPIDASVLSDGNALILDSIRDPGNLGTMIRTADAAGFKAVYCLENTVDPYNEKTIRATMGSLFHIQVSKNQNAAHLFETLRTHGAVICAASLGGITSMTPPVNGEQVALVIGSESHGIRPEIEALCDVSWRLPIMGYAESLNAAVAAGILMYAVVREQQNN